MQLGMVGLGRMGGNLVRRLMRAGIACVVWDRDPAVVAALAAEGAEAATDLPDLVRRLVAPRAVWVMLPAGAATEDAVAQLGGLLSPGDVAIDGGNGMWKDAIRRAGLLREQGIDMLDIGTSGGVWGLARGYCLMIGGPEAPVARLDPVFKALAPGEEAAVPTPGRSAAADPRPPQGYVHCGANGAGHFTKMVHNAVEYGMMQAMAEGLELLRQQGSEAVAPELRLDLDVPDITEAWRRGSVVASWLLDLTAQALAADGELSGYSGRVGDSGEGRWAVQAAIESAVPAPVLSAALYSRFRSRQESPFADRSLSAMRNAFGGHLEPK
ncbi:phosphogluconate dehydrogenase (NAD(+)-dependent, decarboxylating) [Falsiroseomonas sp.]|uniref:phosphogluconate dehydrogenase (NAD(+)-dependent, decarboxylating) n=1 Tax=Falsiroseomonas sp. TaxID=2870721 RepID=UPI0027348764|nr:decarboxylating 6-phosphogluconate dehydrogenase [Falsiroseomonas sp.]MDP3414348.1 decarboxylating 6-phosphogluconate dehydrogenase [Falsiroseomonas sp.]